MGTINANNFAKCFDDEGNLRARYLSRGSGTYVRSVSRRIWNFAFNRYDYEYTYLKQ